MKPLYKSFAIAPVLLLAAGFAYAAGKYAETINVFKNAGESAWFFSHSYGYAVFPTVGEGGFVVGGALGNLVDRLREGMVTDFIKLPDWPAFNLADASITLGVLTLLWVVGRGGAAARPA